MAPSLAVVFSPLATTANEGRGGEAATVLKFRSVQDAPPLAAQSFLHIAKFQPRRRFFLPPLAIAPRSALAACVR